MTSPGRVKPPLGLQRTDVAGFLRTVDTKLQAAGEFLDRGAPWPGLPESITRTTAAQLLLAAPPPRPHPRAANAAAPWSPAGGQPQTAEAGLEGLGWGSCEAADAEHEACSSRGSELEGNDSEVAGPPHHGDTAAAPATALAVEEEPAQSAAGQSEQQSAAEEEPAARPGQTAAAKAGLGAVMRLPAAAERGQRHKQPQQQHERQQGEQQRRRHGSAKVLSWLDNRSGGDDACEPAMDAIPAVHPARHPAKGAPAPASRPLMPAKQAAARGSGWAHSSQPLRPAQPRPRPLSAAAPGAQHSQPPADYWEQLAHSGWVPPKLTLARPSCATCGRAEAECWCTTAAGPLRLLRPRQPGCSPVCSPQRRQQQHGAERAQDSTAQAATLVSRRATQVPPPPLLGQPSAPGAINIASIQTAYFGSSGQPAAAWQAPAPLAAAAATTTAALAPAQHNRWGSSAAAGASRCAELAGPAAGGAELDLWAAYLASRAPAAAGPAVEQHGNEGGSGAVAQLRSISQRIRGMQGHISTFLLQQHQPPAVPMQHQALLPAAGSGSTAPAGVDTTPLAGRQPAPAVPGFRAADQSSCAGGGSRPAQGVSSGMAADPFTDDAILHILTGTDFSKLERAAVAAAGGVPAPGSTQGSKQGAGMGAPGAAAARSDAVQRLKEAQQRAAVQAVRVGRQERGVQRTPSDS